MKLYTIGSLSTSDICISNDPTVSRKHAQLFWDGKGVVVISDLGSLNGTFVNGNKILEPYRLKDLDVVKVGNSLLSWREHVYGDKTIFNTPDLSNPTSTGGIVVEEGAISAKKKLNLTALFWVLPVIVLLVLLFFYLSSEERRLLGEWENKDTKTSYSFFKKHEFEHSIEDHVKSGTFEIVNDELLLQYDRKHLPIKINNLSSTLPWNTRFGSEEYDYTYDIGESFLIKNNCKDTIVLHSLYAGEFYYPSYKDEFVSKVFLYKGDYRNLLEDKKIPKYKFSLVGNLVFEKSTYSNQDCIYLNEVVIPPGDLYSFIVVSNVLMTKSYTENYDDEDLKYDYTAKNNHLIIYPGHSTYKKVEGKAFNLKSEGYRWLGEVNYSLLNPFKDHSFRFIGNNTLKLDTVEYFKQ